MVGVTHASGTVLFQKVLEWPHLDPNNTNAGDPEETHGKRRRKKKGQSAQLGPRASIKSIVGQARLRNSEKDFKYEVAAGMIQACWKTHKMQLR